MNTKFSIAVLFFIFTFLNLDGQVDANSSTFSEKRLALVIGNGNYLIGSLANPENDARSMANVLQELGFTVMKYENISQGEMKKAIDDFGIKLANYDVGLFYYAGHGIQTKGQNYLIPVNAELRTEAQVEYDCVQANRVVGLMEESGAKVKIIILDACRNNPFERSWSRSGSGKGLAVMDAPSGTLIAYATSPGSTASDGTGKNGLYTSAILENINNPGVNILQMFQNVRATVSSKSDKQQIPWESTSLVGDFYFMKSNNILKEEVSDTGISIKPGALFEIPEKGIMLTSLIKNPSDKTVNGKNKVDTLMYVTMNKGLDAHIRKNNYLKIYVPEYRTSTVTGNSEYLKDKAVGTIAVKNTFNNKSDGLLTLNKDFDQKGFNYYESYAKLRRLRHTIFFTSAIPLSGNKNDEQGLRQEYLNIGYITETFYGGIYLSVGLTSWKGIRTNYQDYSQDNVTELMSTFKAGLLAPLGPNFRLGGGVSLAYTSIEYSSYNDYYDIIFSMELLCFPRIGINKYLILGLNIDLDYFNLAVPLGIGFTF